MKKFLSLLLCLLLTVSLCACGGGNGGGETPDAPDYEKLYGSNFRVENMVAEQDKYLYGMCYIAYEGIGQKVDYVKGYEMMNNMGVKSVRNWMHFGYMMSDPNTFRPNAVAQMHDILAQAKKYGMQVIGMNHHNWSVKANTWMQHGNQHTYQPWEGSEYYEWLDIYETCWYNLVKEFPEVTYWEIDNELNNMDFMSDENKPGYMLDSATMADVALDMMFYASRGIHRANPNAITIMGGLVDPWSLGNPSKQGDRVNETNVGFLEILYDKIFSGEHGSIYPDDFFQCAAWHPYYYAKGPDQFFIEENNRIYEVIKRREGKDKKVFLTEFGWNIGRGCTNDQIAEWIPQLYETIKEHMPYVESLHYFRMFDNMANNGETAGIFFDPDPTDWSTYLTKTRYKEEQFIDELVAPGAPKPAAYAYQKAAGGSGSLDLWRSDLD